MPKNSPDEFCSDICREWWKDKHPNKEKEKEKPQNESLPNKTMKVTAIKVKGKDLLPGDLFSRAGPYYWDYIDQKFTVGEQVYIRTNTPCPVDQEEEEIYKIEIEG